jgi:hypothetical protein
MVTRVVAAPSPAVLLRGMAVLYRLAKRFELGQDTITTRAAGLQSSGSPGDMM